MFIHVYFYSFMFVFEFIHDYFYIQFMIIIYFIHSFMFVFFYFYSFFQNNFCDVLMTPKTKINMPYIYICSFMFVDLFHLCLFLVHYFKLFVCLVVSFMFGVFNLCLFLDEIIRDFNLFIYVCLFVCFISLHFISFMFVYQF